VVSAPVAMAGGQKGQIPAAMAGGDQRSSSEARLAQVGLKDKARIEGSFGVGCAETRQQPMLKGIVSEIRNGWILLKYP
jgi:hypothetical protein